MLTDEEIKLIAEGYVLSEYERLGIKEKPGEFEDEVAREADRLKRALAILHKTGYQIMRNRPSMTKPTDTERELQGKWHVDRTIPLTLVILLVGQTAGAIWWASSISSRLSAVEKGGEANLEQARQLNGIAVDVAVLKENVGTTKDDISSMKNGFEMLMQQLLREKTRR